MMLLFLASSFLPAGILIGLFHLLVILIVLAIVYYIIVWILGVVGAPDIINKLVLILCALIALCLVVQFLLGIA
jgi:hypothetical protein